MSLIARRLLLPLLALCAAVTAPLAAGAAPYKVDQSHAFVHFEVTHLGIFPYPGRFKQFRIELDYDRANVENSKVEVDIPLKSLETDDWLMNETLLGDQFFDVRNFQKMSFESTSIKRTGEDTGIIEGELTLHGFTKSVRFDAKFRGTAKSPFGGKSIMAVTAVAEVDRTKWGLTAWRPFVGNTVTIRIGFEASPE
jgi:polyisoprenoid-binding protein YceI